MIRLDKEHLVGAEHPLTRLQIGAHMVVFNEDAMSETEIAFAIERLTDKFTNTRTFYHELLTKEVE